MRTFVHRLKPTRAQHAVLMSMLVDQRRLYNAALEERINAWRLNGIFISLNDQTRSLTQIRGENAAYGGVAYNVSKWTLKRLDDAMKGFFRRVKRGGTPGFPRFRSAGRWSSFGYHQKDGLRINGDRLLLVGLVGGLRMKLHRPLPNAVLKSAVFTTENGVWRVALTMDVAIASTTLAIDAIGVDVGVNYLATTSDGVHFQNIRPRNRRAKDLARAQRALSRCKRGSMRRRKVKAQLAAIQRSVRNHRTTHLHDVANAIVRNSPVIVVEDLKLRNMTRSARGSVSEPGVNVRQKAGLNRVMADAAPGRLIQMLTYKAESAGGYVIRVDPRNTSRTCSGCGIVDAAQAGPVLYRCGCGLVMHRDVNAAINIVRRGCAASGAARRPGVPKPSRAGPATAETLAA